MSQPTRTRVRTASLGAWRGVDLAAFLIANSVFPLSAKASKTNQTSFDDRLDSAFAAVEQSGVAAIVAISHKGGPIIVREFGALQHDGARADDAFDLNSVTRPSRRHGPSSLSRPLRLDETLMADVPPVGIDYRSPTARTLGGLPGNWRRCTAQGGLPERRYEACLRAMLHRLPASSNRMQTHRRFVEQRQSTQDDRLRLRIARACRPSYGFDRVTHVRRRSTLHHSRLRSSRHRETYQLSLQLVAGQAADLERHDSPRIGSGTSFRLLSTRNDRGASVRLDSGSCDNARRAPDRVGVATRMTRKRHFGVVGK